MLIPVKVGSGDSIGVHDFDNGLQGLPPVIEPANVPGAERVVSVAAQGIHEPGGFRCDVAPVDAVAVVLNERGVHVDHLTARVSLAECSPEIPIVACPSFLEHHMVTNVHFGNGNIVQLTFKKGRDIAQGPTVQSVLYTNAVPLIVHPDVQFKKRVWRKHFGDVVILEMRAELPFVVGFQEPLEPRLERQVFLVLEKNNRRIREKNLRRSTHVFVAGRVEVSLNGGTHCHARINCHRICTATKNETATYPSRKDERGVEERTRFLCFDATHKAKIALSQGRLNWEKNPFPLWTLAEE